MKNTKNEKNSSQVFAGKPVLFTFKEGEIRVPCSGCDAPCCREVDGLWISSRQSELISRFSCEQFALKKIGARIYFRIGAGGCPELLPNGNCRLHVESGKRAKPALCALFPFSNLIDTGPFLVVSPNLSFVCPLDMNSTTADGGSSYAEILEDLRFFFGDSASGFGPVKLPEENATTLELERSVMAQMNSTKRHGTILEKLADASGKSSVELEERLRCSLAFLGIEKPPENSLLQQKIMPLIPSFRVDYFGLRSPDIDTAIMVAWNIVRRALSAGGEKNLRRIASLFSAAKKNAAIAAQCHIPVRLQDRPKIEEATDPEIALEAMMVLRDIQKNPGEATLAELVEKHVRSTGWRRTLVLVALQRSGLVFE